MTNKTIRIYMMHEIMVMCFLVVFDLLKKLSIALCISEDFVLCVWTISLCTISRVGSL